MCANLLNLEKDIKELKENQVDYLHLDIMDGHFVKNITLGLDCCAQLKAYDIPRDIHLLVEKPMDFVARLDLQKNDICQCHYESSVDLPEMAKCVHSYGAKFGIVLNPETAVKHLIPYLKDIDVITLMMIKPGFAGLPMEKNVLSKICEASSLLNRYGRQHIMLEVDGHVSVEHVPMMFSYGAQLFVAGTSSIFRSDISIQKGMEDLRNCIKSD